MYKYDLVVHKKLKTYKFTLKTSNIMQKRLHQIPTLISFRPNALVRSPKVSSSQTLQQLKLRTYFKENCHLTLTTCYLSEFTT